MVSTTLLIIILIVLMVGGCVRTAEGTGTRC